MRRRSRSIEPARGCIIVAIALCMCGAVRAEPVWRGSLGLTSDYVQAGLSQTRGEPAIQGGVRADFGATWSVGVWSSQVDRNRGRGATYEIDAYLSRVWRLSPDWIASVTATHSFYPNDSAYLRYDYDELSASVGFRSTAFATVAWSPNTSDVAGGRRAEREPTWAYELTVTQPLVHAWSWNAGVGRRDMTALFGESYWYGHAGVAYDTHRLSLHLTYTRADDTAHRLFGDERAADTLVGSVIWKLDGGH